MLRTATPKSYSLVRDGNEHATPPDKSLGLPAGAKRVAFVGHSHMVTMKKALQEPDEKLISATFTSVTSFEPIRDPIPEALAKLLDRVCTGVAAICLQLRGNQHTVYGLLRQNPAFDVVISREPNLELIPEAEIIPEAAFASFFERSLEGLKGMIKYLKGKGTAPVVVLGPPPPIEDPDFLVPRLDAYFVKRLTEMGVAKTQDAITASLVRWKVWHILDRVYESIALQNGAIWLPIPEEALHAKRFLDRRAWGEDATHANAWYGKLRLRQIEAAIK